MFRNLDEKKFYERLENYYLGSNCTTLEKLANFPRFVPRQFLARFLFKYELMKRVLPCQGSIVECGVYLGGGLMTFAHLSSILEPYNYQRKVIGFDTFKGFQEFTDEDTATDLGRNSAKIGAFRPPESIENELNEATELFDLNRPLGHMEKIQLIKGDATNTISEYLESNPHTIISLLYLDFDLYKPTQSALEALAIRIPKGGVIAFDELNSPVWPGETQAVQDVLGISNLRIQRFPFDTMGSFAVIE